MKCFCWGDTGARGCKRKGRAQQSRGWEGWGYLSGGEPGWENTGGENEPGSVWERWARVSKLGSYCPSFFGALAWIWERWDRDVSLLSCSYPGREMQGMSWIALLEQGLSAPIHVPPSWCGMSSVSQEANVLSSSGSCRGINHDASQSLGL